MEFNVQSKFLVFPIRQISYYPFYAYYELSLVKEEINMALGNVDGAACGCGKDFGPGIAVVVIIILLLIAMGIVF